MTRCFISLESSHHLPLMAGDGGEGGQVRGLPYGDRCFERLLESVRKQKRGACTCAHAHTSHTCAHTPHNYTRAHAHTHTSICLTIQSGCGMGLGASWFAPTFSEAHASWWQLESWYLKSYKKIFFFSPKEQEDSCGLSSSSNAAWWEGIPAKMSPRPSLLMPARAREGPLRCSAL